MNQSPAPMEPTLDTLKELAEQLPPFDPATEPADLPGLAPYLSHYGIDHPDASYRPGHFHSGGFRLAVHYWRPAHPRGTLVLVHGYYDHVGIYGPAIRFALGRGYAVLAPDLPGHGLSSGEPAAIESFDQYADALDELLTFAQPRLPAPFHALGQSTGASVLLNYLWRHGTTGLDRVVLFSPLVIPFGWRSLGRFMHRALRPFVHSISRKFVDSSHDEAFNQFIRHRDPLQATRLPVSWVDAMKAWDRATDTYPLLRKPLLIVQGTGDTTVDWRYNIKKLQRKIPQAQVEWIDKAGHQLVNEVDTYREAAFTAAGEWLDR